MILSIHKSPGLVGDQQKFPSFAVWIWCTEPRRITGNGRARLVDLTSSSGDPENSFFRRHVLGILWFHLHYLLGDLQGIRTVDKPQGASRQL